MGHIQLEIFYDCMISMLKRNGAGNGVGVEGVIEKQSKAGKVSQQAMQDHFLRNSGGLLAVIGESLESNQEYPKMEKGKSHGKAIHNTS